MNWGRVYAYIYWKWQLPRIPCGHTVSVVYKEKGKPENFVDGVYTKEIFLLKSWAFTHYAGRRNWATNKICGHFVRIYNFFSNHISN